MLPIWHWGWLDSVLVMIAFYKNSAERSTFTALSLVRLLALVWDWLALGEGMIMFRSLKL